MVRLPHRQSYVATTGEDLESGGVAPAWSRLTWAICEIVRTRSETVLSLMRCSCGL